MILAGIREDTLFIPQQSEPCITEPSKIPARIIKPPPVLSHTFVAIGQMVRSARITTFSFDLQVLLMFTLTTRLEQPSGFRAPGV